MLMFLSEREKACKAKTFAPGFAPSARRAFEIFGPILALSLSLSLSLLLYLLISLNYFGFQGPPRPGAKIRVWANPGPDIARRVSGRSGPMFGARG